MSNGKDILYSEEMKFLAINEKCGFDVFTTSFERRLQGDRRKAFNSIVNPVHEKRSIRKRRHIDRVLKERK